MADETRALLLRLIAWSEQRDAHVRRGYVLHEEHQRAVLSLDQERQSIIAAAKLVLAAS